MTVKNEQVQIVADCDLEFHGVKASEKAEHWGISDDKYVSKILFVR